MASRNDLPPIVDVVLELGIKRMRTAVGESRQEAYLPRVILWVDQKSGVIVKFSMVEPHPDYTRPVLESLDEVIGTVRGLPREVRLRDVALATRLQPLLAKVGISVVVREDLPVLDEAFAAMLDMGPLAGKVEPGLLDVPGMTLDHVHAFADGAKLFFEARPWRHLLDEDLIHVHSPAGPKGTQFTTVLGAGGEVFGLGFVATRAAHDEMQAGGGLPRGGLWSLQFGDLDSQPYEDGEVWVEKGLPVAGPRGFPSFLKYSRSKRPGYPTPAELVWAEGLLRAMAATTEDELDSGKWEKTVQTHDGPATYQLSLPILLEQMAGKKPQMGSKENFAARSQMEEMMRGLAQRMADGTLEPDADGHIEFSGDPPKFEPTNDAERAQALVYEARQATGRRSLQLARQALAIDPDCTDALVLLAERKSDPAEKIPLLRRAVEAGEKALGKEYFEENAGEFWGAVETRPYMRSRQQLANALFDTGEIEEAATHLRELLRLNPGDNQGNRYLLAQALLHTNNLDELDHLLNTAYPDEDMAEWAFTRALLEFRRGGDSPAARKRLADAAAVNPYVVPLLTGRMGMPPILPPHYSRGSEEEAVLAVNEIAEMWDRTPNALEWIEEVVPKPQRQKRKKGPGKRRK
jgi:tetratricopeptide (TPR) repeat protein